ncbi:protocadherin gamma-A6-like isoform X16 [Rhineura floridana]|uniref:protocadherin gamma-A6-like isoform X16 n=1 Tax=Rhineura floridana TaxID=261503 RepID=UPI002AC81806|nr:protocadherin gamma-A6-like isoform X16 [Rhineura floridana]
MTERRRLQKPARRCLFCYVLIIIWEKVSGQIHYSIPEEVEKGSLVGNIALDLGMDIKEISDSKVRISCGGRIQYFDLNYETGHLYTTKRIDREEICDRIQRCMLNCDVIIKSKMKLFAVEVEITDINDNAPRFPSREQKLKISETSTPGSQFPLPEAHDPDLGINTIQSFQLTGSSHFSLDVQMGEEGVRRIMLVLKKYLDREEQSAYDLFLTASDGGNPVRSGIVQIQIIVLDANDNGPIFSQHVYEVNVKENIPRGSTVCTVRATDLDEGNNGDVNYFFKNIGETASQIFLLDSASGEITLARNLDYEESPSYEFEVQAEDGGGLSDRSKVLIIVTDVNDNIPQVEIASHINSVPEDSPPGTVVALLNIHDQDSGMNGKVFCSIDTKFPFQLKKSYNNYYSLMTERSLDREQEASYNISITVTDHGIPPLSTTCTISLHVLDTNDNHPHFAKPAYTSYLMENNRRGASVFSLNANDPDSEENSKITYSIIEGLMTGSSLSSYLSINSETGVIYALNSFDYEEFQEIQFLVRAQDGGSPPLSSNVSVTLFFLDQNDNAPEILYPSPPTDGSTGIELAPHSSEPGYLVTKVVAVDADSGQNAWLSYQLIKATEPGLFTLGLHTGEIRTARFFLEKDALKQSLVVLVKDNGQPPLSASVTVTVVLADTIPAILSDLSSISAPVDPPSDLTFYLVIGVAFVSCLFFIFLLVLLAIRLHRWRNSQLFDSGDVNFSGVPVSQFVGIDGVRAFLHSYCNGFSLTTESNKSKFKLSMADCSNTLTNEQAKNTILTAEYIGGGHQSFEQQAQPNMDWRFSQAQRPGTSGSQNGDENGTWPNNQFDTEMLQAMILASANEAAAAAAAANPDGNSTLGGGATAGTMGLSTRYGPQFTLQHVPDYRQNVYIPGSTATLSNSSGKHDGKPAASGGGNKKKSGKKEKK